MDRKVRRRPPTGRDRCLRPDPSGLGLGHPCRCGGMGLRRLVRYEQRQWHCDGDGGQGHHEGLVPTQPPAGARRPGSRPERCHGRMEAAQVLPPRSHVVRRDDEVGGVKIGEKCRRDGDVVTVDGSAGQEVIRGQGSWGRLLREGVPPSPHSMPHPLVSAESPPNWSAPHQRWTGRPTEPNGPSAPTEPWAPPAPAAPTQPVAAGITGPVRGNGRGTPSPRQCVASSAAARAQPPVWPVPLAGTGPRPAGGACRSGPRRPLV